jgi:hypothetical protein
MVFVPSIAHADSIDLHGAKQCLIDTISTSSDHVRDGSVGLSHNDTRAQAAGGATFTRRSGLDDNEADGTFTRRSGLENSEHFATHGSPQVFADDRISFDDDNAIAFNDLANGIVRQILAALRESHENHGRGSDSHDGDHGHHGEHGGSRSGPSAPNDPSLGPNPILTPVPIDATPNPEPASMLLIGTGLAGLFGFRRRLL